jgi:hypothetical protein
VRTARGGRSTHVEVTIPTQSPSATVGRYDSDRLQPCFDPLLEATVDDEEAFVRSTYHSYHAAAFTVSRASPLAPPCNTAVGRHSSGHTRVGEVVGEGCGVCSFVLTCSHHATVSTTSDPTRS